MGLIAILIDDLHHVMLGLNDIAMHLAILIEYNISDLVVILVGSLLIHISTSIVFSTSLKSLSLRIGLILFV